MERAGQDRQPQPAGSARRSVLTGVWLVALLAGAVGLVSDQLWPAQAGGMFAFSTSSAAMGELSGRTASGDVVALEAAGFGLERVQLSEALRRSMGPTIGFEDLPVLADVASWWNERHPERAVVEVSLRVEVVELEAGSVRHEPTLLTWRRP